MRRGHGDSEGPYGNPLLRDRLTEAVRKTDIPVFVIQPPKDASLEPARFLAPTRAAWPAACRENLSARDAQEQHGDCFAAPGMHGAPDALSFFAGALR